MTPGQLDTIFGELYPILIESLERAAGGPFVAGVVADGVLVGTGTNTVLADTDVTRHAEMNALSAAGAATGLVHLPAASLLTSHFPCLMCYHAAKWARIRDIFYLFDYEQTEDLFGFHGDLRFLEDLGLERDALLHDGSVSLHRHTGKAAELYSGELVQRWRNTYARRCQGYDV